MCNSQNAKKMLYLDWLHLEEFMEYEYIKDVYN